MIRLTFLLILVTFQTFAQVANDTYSIYSLIVNEELKSDSITYQNILILSKTSSQHAPASIEAVSGYIKMDQPVFCSYPGNMNDVIKANPEIKELILSLDKVRDKKTALSSSFTINCSYKLLEPKLFYNTFRKSVDEGWANLQKENTGLFGVVDFSNVIIQNNFAVVYFGYQQNPFRGSGSLIVLKKENGVWKIISHPEIWHS